MKPTITASTFLDRLSHKRHDEAYLQSLHKAEGTRFLVLVDGKPVIHSNEERTVASIRWFHREDLARLGLPVGDALFLGIARTTVVGHFAVAATEHWVRHARDAGDVLSPFVDLRSLAAQGIMSSDELSLIGQAKALAAWHDNARCCGHCGGTTHIKDGGWKRKCWACGQEWFPRVDPVAIMLITDGVRCVLAHEPRFPERMYSTLAGFVEPGEDIECTVRREVREEVGLDVDEVRFHMTQPWPYQHSLMIGCFGTVRPGQITVDRNELDDARWFTRADVRQMLEGRHPEGLWVPGRQAIAHALITAFAASA